MRDQPDRLAWLLRDFIAQKVVALPSGNSPERR
jgi:hypothetical protein